MPIPLDQLPKPLGVYMEISFLDGQGKKCIYLVNYPRVGPWSEMTFDQETLFTDEPLPDNPFPAFITSRSLEKYNIKLEARFVEIGDPYSEAKQAVLKLLEDAAADPTFARSPRKILDRLKTL